MIDLSGFEFLSFDCYGTLIDWEAGLIPPLRSFLAAHDITQTDEELLERYARHESTLQTGAFRSYRAVLRGVVSAFAEDFGIHAFACEQDVLVHSLADWPPFPDTIAALRVLKRRYLLEIISNVDDDLFVLTAARLKVPFNAVVTAQQVGAYSLPD